MGGICGMSIGAGFGWQWALAGGVFGTFIGYKAGKGREK
jgi:hypothetical protein